MGFFDFLFRKNKKQNVNAIKVTFKEVKPLKPLQEELNFNDLPNLTVDGSRANGSIAIKKSKTNKSKEVLMHLVSGKSITSWEAINFYGATRLASIVFNLKDKGFDIQSKSQISIDRNGNQVKYSEYFLVVGK
jgi:hypothetical protein